MSTSGYCIVTRAASMAIRTDFPRPCREMQVSVIGEIILSLVAFAGPLQNARCRAAVAQHTDSPARDRSATR